MQRGTIIDQCSINVNTGLENLGKPGNYNEEVVDLTKSHGKVIETYMSWKTALVDFRVLTGVLRDTQNL